MLMHITDTAVLCTQRVSVTNKTPQYLPVTVQRSSVILKKMKFSGCRTEVVIDFVLLLLAVYCVTVTCEGPCLGEGLYTNTLYMWGEWTNLYSLHSLS